ncbi:alpha/beta fold hydrolase [Chitinolyticbacter albus]|uniref:alpha/beta fold hydrolase n=1 Tax=Chitinolyticbacter albus TaxID=2961951 RepID=UPI00210D8AE4|nr:alpha/beta hydrolase [Chitinolyticbacter albus]
MKAMADKRVFTVGTRQLECLIAGDGPVIVLVNGAGGPIEGWFRVWPELCELGRVLAYNRPGLGRSARANAPQTGAAMVGTLRELLQAAALPPPYVLVGHSLGGLVVNLYARLHPADVAAVLLLESTAPDDVAAMAKLETPLQRGLRRLLDTVLPPDPLGEVAQLPNTLAQLAAAPPFPDVPLTVLSGGKRPWLWPGARAAFDIRAMHQRQLAQLSLRGVQRVAERSGHFPQLSEPQIVRDALAELLQRSAV